MENGFRSPSSMLGSQLDPHLEFDYMDELLLEGCWLETTVGSEFHLPSPSNSAALFDTAVLWPGLDTNDDDSVPSLSKKTNQEYNQVSSFATKPSNPVSVLDRLIRAIGYIKDLTGDKDVLVQIWVPVDEGGRRVLITYDQPFLLNPKCNRLVNYRDISIKYQFSAEKNSRDVIGLPGRVFLGKIPEWTPDVQLFTSDEYARVRYAKEFDVHGTLAMPVFEQGCTSCLGVIEVVTTEQKTEYYPELQSVCRALEAVHLRSTAVPNIHNVKIFDKSYEAALPEILQVLKAACDMHKLPLAQTWVSCTQQGKTGCRHSEENYFHCISTISDASYVADSKYKGFYKACSEHHLLKGQGVAGQAFLTNQPCFSSDVTRFVKTDYPLSHHARMFKLCAAVAIRLRSIYLGSCDFVLEFFLPVNCKEHEEQWKLLRSLSTIIEEICRSLRIVTDRELEEETEIPFPSYQVKKNETGMLRDRALDTDASARIGLAKTGEKKSTKAEKTITFELLQKYFAGSLKDAAKSLGVCPTTLKRTCRQHGIKRWPSRKLKKVDHSLRKIKLVIDSVQESSGSFQIGSFYTNFPELASPNELATDHPKPMVLVSPSSSRNQCSSSRHSLLSGDVMLKRVSSKAKLNLLTRNEPKLLHRWQSHDTLKKKTTIPSLEEMYAKRVKVSYGNEHIRFRMPDSWVLSDLMQEIAIRFNIDDINRFDVKYMDDESELVLLTCDADLEERIDVWRSSESHTIKLILGPISHHFREKSVLSSCPSRT